MNVMFGMAFFNKRLGESGILNVKSKIRENNGLLIQKHFTKEEK